MTLNFTHRQVWQIALPLVISNITVPLLGLVDTMVMGHLPSPLYLAAVAVGATIFSFLFLGFNFLRMGTTGFAAQAFGRNDQASLRRVLMRSLVLAAFIAGIFILLQKPIIALALKLIGPDPDVANIAAGYYSIRILAAPASLMNIVFIGWFIGLQNARVPLLLMVCINTINIVLDIVFVMYVGMNANGVALASVIAEYAGCLLGFVIAWRSLDTSQRRQLFEGVWNVARFRALLGVNLDLLIRTLALQFSFAFLTAVGARQGSAILAANAVLLNFQHLMSYALDGFANAAEALVGRAIGANEPAALRQAIALSRWWSVIIALVLAVLYWFGGPLLVNAMTDLPQIRELAYEFLPWLVLSPIISVWCFLYDGVFVGALASRQMRNIMVVSTFAIFVPAWFVLQGFGNHGLWIAFLLFMGARGVLMHFVWQRISAIRYSPSH
ncbi:MAG: MATE family efflux transporter [Gammaproteobacteria bacterium]|nr:MATE family efflux transporter [Gammaproteobacteria bacterium]